jgi:tetratricopeptide (TPR) repeat protein
MSKLRLHPILLGLLFATIAAQGADEALEDLIARVQFDFYAADARALQRDLISLGQHDASNSTLHSYYLAYGHLKLAEILREQRRADARKAAVECADLAERTAGIEANRGSTTAERARVDQINAELWALQAACSSLAAELSIVPGSTSLSLASFRSSKASERAFATAPNNPRVKLLEAVQDARRADSADDWSRASQKLQTVVAIFDALPPSADDVPDWGQAEALAWLGQAYVKRGDKVAARNALERALVLAPDYAWVSELLKQLSAK